MVQVGVFGLLALIMSDRTSSASPEPPAPNPRVRARGLARPPSKPSSPKELEFPIAQPSSTSPGASEDYSDEDVRVTPPRRSPPQRGPYCRRRSRAVTPRRENVEKGRREKARSSSRYAHFPGEPASKRSKIVGDANPDELHGVRERPRRSMPKR